jgi:hypothetical protein
LGNLPCSKNIEFIVSKSIIMTKAKQKILEKYAGLHDQNPLKFSHKSKPKPKRGARGYS